VTQGIIENGVILVRDGKIVGISREGSVPTDAVVIDASHSVVMPGMIDAQSFLGLHTETEPSLPSLASGGSAGGRRGGVGQFAQQAASPQAASAAASTRMKLVEALLPGDPAFQEALRSGVTEILLSPPVSGSVCGQAALIKTLPGSFADPTNRGRIVKESAAICFNMQGEPRMGQPWLFRDLLTASKGYLLRRAAYERAHKQWEQDRDEAKLQKKDPPAEPTEVPRDEDQEPLAALFRGEIPAFVHAGRADEILAALKVFRDENSLSLTLVDAGDGFRVAEEIRKRSASVVLGPEILRTDRGRIVNNADALAQAGVPVLFAGGSGSGTQFLRLNAAYAVRNGMDPAEALRALTLTPARTLHVEDRLGSIDVGKDADLVILSGDPLEVTSRVEKVLVNGKVSYDAK
jgi:imidazolonepropionase-like amidohydrolase